VLYGAAEFSRDVDFVILADGGNLSRLSRVVGELDAEVIAIPRFESKFLKRGHSIHFRCRHPEAAGLRLDVMAKMRGVEGFSKLWKRRVTVELPDGGRCDVVSLPDLVLAKKTQRDKDWPMIRRLVEAHYFQNRAKPSRADILFWLREMRTGNLLIEVARRNSEAARKATRLRPLLKQAVEADLESLEKALQEEELSEKERDRLHWLPLKAELEKLRHQMVRARR
jgi:hypothetical protein